MGYCSKIAKYSGMLFGMIAGVLVLFGIIGFFMWILYASPFLNVANFWLYMYASVPFCLLAICCTLFVISGKEKA
ncbi:MAG: hypothetical protein HQ565_05145 [Bacteroidetes bacterium]|nr:hypothetical protein [Bacteroidota bacterium]